MTMKILLKANMKRHKITMIGVSLIMMMVAFTLISVISIWLNTTSYVHSEMDRIHYGDMSVWTQNVQNQEQLRGEIEQLQEVDTVTIQQIIYADYRIDETESDSEGQLIAYEPQIVPYRIFNESNTGYQENDISIQPNDIYISPSLLSTYNIAIGDEITFLIGRAGNEKTFTVKGMYEDPFMGSSMIGMKGFLISQIDYDEIVGDIQGASMDALASVGQMFHIKQSTQSGLNHTQFNQLLNSETQLQEYTTFAYSRDAIAGFMLILQNAFTGLFLAFALILFIVSIVIIGYSIGSSVEQDKKNMAILKTIGYESSKIRKNLKIQYLMFIFIGVLAGVVLSQFVIPQIAKMMLSFAGILTPSTSHITLWIAMLLFHLLFFYVYIHRKTREIETIPPIVLLQGELGDTAKNYYPLHKKGLLFSISIRQILSGKRRYISVGITAILLVFFVSMIGRMNVWLGVDGKGMMDAFNPADLDLGVQLLGKHEQQDVEKFIEQYSTITDSYGLAMPNVALGGVDVTANVITEPHRFHIQQGATIQNEFEIVITETIAKDQNVQLNDEITVSYNGQSASYQIVGIYQCANEMGGNIGMSNESFQRIGIVTSNMWCYHYFLEDTSQKQMVIDSLNNAFGGDVYIHENTWPGLFSIISMMQALLIFMYVVTALFILVVTTLTGNKIFLSEKRNLSIYKTLGFTTKQLRMTFAIRYGLIAGIGSVFGIFISNIFTDTLVGTLMKLYGIANFTSHLSIVTMFLPGIIVSVLFMMFAYWVSRKMKYLDMNELLAE